MVWCDRLSHMARCLVFDVNVRQIWCDRSLDMARCVGFGMTVHQIWLCVEYDLV